MNKRLKSVLTLTLICALFASSTALAEKLPLNFDIDKGTTSYSAKNPKSDNEQKAYVTITSHNLISGDSVRYVVAKPTTSTEVSNATTYTGVNYPNKKTFDYNSGENAKKGNNYRLKVKSNNYWVWLKGQWNS